MKFTISKPKNKGRNYSEVDLVPKAHDDFLTDINNLYAGYLNASYRLDYIHGRDREIDDIFTCLQLNLNNNVLLIGENGVGKKAIIQAAVLRVLNGQCPSSLKDVHFFALESEKIEAIENSNDKKASKKNLKAIQVSN